jgi:CRISPR-associated protein Csy1
MEDLEISQDDYSEIYNLFSTNKKNNENKLSRTSKLVSQVYFNVGDTFHLLSVLFPSCIMSELKKRILEINIKKKDINIDSYSRIPNLTQLKIGGTKPLNVSFMNNANGGNYLLLNASPPELVSQKRVPKKDFFSIFGKDLNSYFQELKDMFPDITNVELRNKREKIIETIVLKVADKIFELRSLDPGWSKEGRNNLPVYQKILLDQINENERMEDKKWLIDFMSDFSKWILHSCNKFLDSNKAFGDIQLSDFITIIKKNKDMFL